MKKNVFLDTSNFVRIATAQLKIGMYVAQLDRPWLETPFLMQGFVIRRQSEIRKLQEYCKEVYVEKEGRLWGNKKDPFQASFGVKRNALGGDQSGLKDRGKHGKKKESLVLTRAKRPEHKVTREVAEEHQVAREVYSHAHNTVADVLEQARMGNAIETTAAKEVVTQCADSIIRNPNAMMWMAKIKHVDQYTMEHCINVCVLAIAFGRHLRLEETELEKLGLCGLLHDVGKMQIPDEILNKPAELTEDEFEQMSQHPRLGRDLLLKAKDAHHFTVDVAFNHHERMDGKGYPRELFAAELSDYTRIISIVDAFDAMTSERCYDVSKSTLEALKEIYRQRGKQFDEELALEFIQLIGPYPPGTLVELENGCVGIVLSSQLKKRHLPRVKIILDKNKQQQEEELVDLLDVERGTVPRDHLVLRVLKDGAHGIFLEQYPVRRALAGMQASTEDDTTADSTTDKTPS